MKEKSPAFQMYPKDYLSDLKVQVMSLQEEGAYNRLLMVWWNERGYLPNDDEELAKIVGKECTVDIIRVVKKCFIPDPIDNTKLIQPRLQKEIVKQAEWSKKSSKAGKKSAEKRWGSKGSDKDKVGYKMVEPKSNSSSSSPSPSPIKYIIEGELFDNARKAYPGDKRGNETEFANFIRKHADWKNVLPTLEEKIKIQIAARDRKLKENKFVPEWKKFTTWINQRCWEEEIGEGVGKPGEEQKTVYKGDFFNKKKQ